MGKKAASHLGSARTRSLPIRLHESEWRDIVRAAALTGTPPSTFARDAILAAAARVLKRSQR